MLKLLWRLAVLALLTCAATPVLAQGCGPSNPNCIVTTMPLGDASNRAASDAFVQQQLNAFTLPAPTPTTLGGVFSKTCNSSNWFSSLSTSGTFGCTQPSFSDLTGQIINAMVSPSAAIDSTKLSYTAPATGAVAQTASAKFAQMLSIQDFGAVPDSGVTDNGPALRLAYDAAAASGAAIYIPPSSGYYGVTTCRNNAVFDGASATVANGNKSVSIYGAGWNEKPFATPQGSWLLPNSSFPSTCSWIRLSGTDKVSGTTYKDFGIGEFGGAFGTPKGLHGIFIDASNALFYIQNMVINHVFIANMATGQSINCTTGSVSSPGCIPEGAIYDSNFMSFKADFLADHVRIVGNTLGQNATVDSRNVGIEFTNCSGCASTTIDKNNISNFNGMIVVHGAGKPVIRDNELELGNVTNTNGAMVDLNGSVSVVDGATVTGNHFSQNSTVSNYAPVNVANAAGTQIYDNRIIEIAGSAYDYITVTGAASGTFFGFNRCEFNAGVSADLACTVSSLGPNGFAINGGNYAGLSNFTGQLRTTFGTPTIASGACGTGTNGTISGANQAGIITIGAVATTTCTVSFSTTITAPKACLIFPGNAAAATTGTTVARVGTPSATAWAITGSALANTVYSFICL